MEEPISYEEFLKKLDLMDDKTSSLLYDLYKYELSEKENKDRSIKE